LTSSSDDSEIDLTKSDLAPENMQKEDPENKTPESKEINSRIEALETKFNKIESDVNKIPMFLDEFSKQMGDIIELKFKSFQLPTTTTAGGGGIMDMIGPVLRSFMGNGGGSTFGLEGPIMELFKENFQNTLTIQQIVTKGTLKELYKKFGIAEHVEITPK